MREWAEISGTASGIDSKRAREGDLIEKVEKKQKKL